LAFSQNQLSAPMNNSVVLAGFPTSLATRIFFAQAKLVMTADATTRAGKFVLTVVKEKHRAI
jgi:acyl-coenzyme A synthetase/AMP-(fatty) acid ligase